LPSPRSPNSPLDFRVADGAAEADAVDVGEWDEHGGFVRNDPKMVEAAGRTEDRFLLDALHDSQAMIRVYDLVADFKCHSSPCLTKLRCYEANEVRKRALNMEGRHVSSSPLQYSSLPAIGQSKRPEKTANFASLDRSDTSPAALERSGISRWVR
jgi:hypothetical protein